MSSKRFRKLPEKTRDLESEAVDKLKVVDQEFYDLARVFFG